MNRWMGNERSSETQHLSNQGHVAPQSIVQCDPFITLREHLRNHNAAPHLSHSSLYFIIFLINFIYKLFILYKRKLDRDRRKLLFQQ